MLMPHRSNSGGLGDLLKAMFHLSPYLAFFVQALLSAAVMTQALALEQRVHVESVRILAVNRLLS